MTTTTSKKMAMLLLIASAAYDGIFDTGRARNWAVSADPITLPGGFVLATPPTGDVALFNVKQSKSPKGLRTNSPTMTRKPVTAPNSQQQPPSPSSASQPSSPTSSPTSSDTCSNLTCTPGMTAFEYLGMGYDIINGNPRGSFSSELDPGFRSRVIKLDYDKGYLTTDHEYKVPFATELRRSTSCKFSSSSVEVSSSSDYQKQLSNEAETSESLSVNAKVSGGIGSFSASASFSQDQKFTGSQKYEEFSQARSSEKTTTFEAKALCTEFTANIQPDAQIQPDAVFHSALSSLTVPFDRNSNRTIEAYTHFFRTYGTHYVHHLVLGAKHIYSTVMKASDAMELSKQNIDVKSSLSVQRQAEISGSYGAASAEVGGKTENNSTNSNSLKNERMEEIKKKVERVDQVNVGGVPPVDGKWETWAASVVKRPMPIVYKLTGIWEMMDTEEQKDAFKDAIEYLYGIEIDPPKINTTYLKSFHFGVSGPDGTLVSDYSYSSNFEYRALLSVGDAQKITDGKNYSYISFDVVWEGRSQSAVFATSINNLLSPSYEDKERGSPITSLALANYFTPFGLNDGTYGQAKIQFAGFKNAETNNQFWNQLDEGNLQRFSFLTATSSSDKKLVSGLIHPGGFAVSDNFNTKIPFDISKPERNKWLIEFGNEFEKVPTIVLFPVWFPSLAEKTRKPESPMELLTYSDSCTTKQCSINAFKDSPFLGFSFLAIDGNLTNAPGVVHGSVDIHSAISPGVPRAKPGYTETFYFDQTNVLVGVEIIFDNKFAGIPSVVASIHESGSVNWVGFVSQSIIVDHITSKSAFIKVGRVSPGRQGAFLVFSPMSFAFVAVGPADAKR